MQVLLLGTGNMGKQKELLALLAELPLVVTTPQERGLSLKVEETGNDYRENASRKALKFAAASGLWTLADDSGLEVEVLEGAPGLHSARLAGPTSTDHQRRQALLRLLREHPRPWLARFRSTMALTPPEGPVTLVQGTCEGEIIPEERGPGGFGYDPLFLVQGTDCTMAQLSTAEKNRISHRARAFQALRPTLIERLGVNAPPRV